MAWIATKYRPVASLVAQLGRWFGVGQRVSVVYQLIVTVVPLVLLVQLLAMLVLELRASSISNVRGLERLAKFVDSRASAMGDPLWKLDYDKLAVGLNEIALEVRVIAAFVEDDTGTVVAQVAGKSTHARTGRHVRPLVHTSGNGDVLAGQLVVDYASLPVSTQISEFYGSSVFVSMLAALVLSFATRYAAQALVGRPLSVMMEAIRLSRVGEGSHRVVLNFKNEFADLAAAFNELQDAQSQAKELLEFQATHDDLTGLPNRRLLHQRLCEIGTGPEQTVALHFIDLDDFKGINDTFGHEAGDRYLVHVASRLRACVGAGGWVARQGGDEFIVLQNHVEGNEGAKAFAADILAAISEPVDMSGKSILPRASIGVAVRNTQDPEIANLLALADIALYRAKQEQAGSIMLLTQDLLRAHTRHKELASALPAAFEQNQIEVWFQGQFDIATGDLAGLEALVRWRHPERGVISPAEFVPLIEQTGRSTALASLVFDGLCQARLLLEQEGLADLPIAMNVSPHELTDLSFGEEMAVKAAHYGVSLSGFEIEITEGLLINNVAQTHEALAWIRASGVRVALDDFGQGYSSLAYLRRFPLDRLKIDKAFTRDVPENSGDLAILEIIVALADKLHLEVVAEGIERPEQAETLGRLGVRVGQGFLYHRPQPIEDVIAFIRRRQAGPAPLRAAS